MPGPHRTTTPGAEPAHQRKPVGTFVKPGPDGTPVERLAWTPSHAVALTFDGWRPKTSTPEPAPPADTVSPPRETQRAGSSTKSRRPALRSHP